MTVKKGGLDWGVGVGWGKRVHWVLVAEGIWGNWGEEFWVFPNL